MNSRGLAGADMGEGALVVLLDAVEADLVAFIVARQRPGSAALQGNRLGRRRRAR